jgi:2-methylcitrate dehydratase PrpD
MDIMGALVRNLTEVTFQDLSSEAVSASKRSIMDTLGAVIAGSSVDGCQKLAVYLKSWGGLQESTVAVFGEKVPSFFAAQANGAMARALELDDVSDEFVLHPSVSVVPATLAAAERKGNVSGKQLITAVALGQDLMFRMAASVKQSPIDSGRYNLFRVFAAAGAAGKVLGLSESELRNGMGIAYSQLSGEGQSARDGAMAHYVQSGTVAKSAIEAVLLAQTGITGPSSALQGPSGFYTAIEPDHDLEPLISNLGKVFRGTEICVKPYPSCRLTHESIDLALEFRQNEDLDYRSIEQIIVRVNDQCFNLVCHPVESKRRPQTFIDAQFSLPYTVAAAVVKGDVFIHELSEQAIRDQDTLSLAQRIVPIYDKACQNDFSVGATMMEVRNYDGKVFRKECQFPSGNPKKPLSLSSYVGKFTKCVEFSKRPFAEKQVENMIEVLSSLEEIDDVAQVTELLCPVQSDD